MAQPGGEPAETPAMHDMSDFWHSSQKFPVSRLLVYLICRCEEKSIYTQVYCCDWLAPLEIIQPNYTGSCLGIAFSARGSFTALPRCHTPCVHHFHWGSGEGSSSADLRISLSLCLPSLARKGWTSQSGQAARSTVSSRWHWLPHLWKLNSHLPCYGMCALAFTRCISYRWSTPTRGIPSWRKSPLS